MFAQAGEIIIFFLEFVYQEKGVTRRREEEKRSKRGSSADLH
jgi:hypothetical protein